MTKANRTYIFTYLTEFSLLIAGLLVYRFAYNSFNEIDSAAYSIIRRYLSFFVPLLFLGLAVGIPRFVSFNLDNKTQNGNYFIAGALILLCSVIIFSIAIFIFKVQLAELIFDNKKLSYLILPLQVLIIGIAIHSLAYSYLRGSMKMHLANTLQFLNLCVGNLLGFALSDKLSQVIYYTGFYWIITATLFLLYILWNINFEWKHIRKTAKELFMYSIFRVPGDIALAALFTMPSLFIAHYYGIIPSGYVAVSITLLNMAGAAFSPISLLLLPKISKLAADKNYDTIFSNSKKIIAITLLLSVSAVLIFEFFATPIMHIYLKTAPPHLVNTARIIALGIPGYTLYIVLRSVLDALHYRAVNTRNLLISFIFYCVGIVMLFLFNIHSETLIGLNIWIFSVSLSILGILTYFDYRKSRNSFLKK